MQIQVMQITIRQCQTGNYLYNFTRLSIKQKVNFKAFFKSWKCDITKFFWYIFSNLQTDMMKRFSS